MMRPEEALLFEERRPYIAAALEYAGGTHTVEDVRAGCEDGTFQFWPAPHSVVVTEVLRTPQQLIVHVFLAAGRMDEIEEVHDRVEDWARRIGAHKLTLVGRPGWTRSFLARRKGWRTRSMVIMERAL